MAQRRMFSLQIVDTDAFLDMSATAQLLYFHLAMRGDDDGFVDNPKRIMKMIGANDDDIKILIAKRFILTFENGIVVIKHWKIHNYIQKDRYKSTKYIEQKKALKTKENGAYTEVCTQNGYSLDTQVRLGKVRQGKNTRVFSKEKNVPPLLDNQYEDDDGRIITVADEVEEKKTKSKSMSGLIAWAVKKRGGAFPNILKQKKAIKKMRDTGITDRQISARWVELEDKDWFQENGMDFMSVCNSFDKKPL